MNYRLAIRSIQFLSVCYFGYLLFTSLFTWLTISGVKDEFNNDGTKEYIFFTHIPATDDAKFEFGIIRNENGEKKLFLITDHLQFTQNIDIVEEASVLLSDEKKIIPFNAKHSSMTPISIDEYDTIISWWEGRKIVQLMLVASLITLTWKMLSRFMRFEFFDVKNYRAIILIGIILILWPIIYWVGESMIIETAFDFTSISDDHFFAQIKNQLEWRTVLFGFTLLIFSAILKKGMELKEEQDLTI